MAQLILRWGHYPNGQTESYEFLKAESFLQLVTEEEVRDILNIRGMQHVIPEPTEASAKLQNCELMNECSFKPLSSWPLVMQW